MKKIIKTRMQQFTNPELRMGANYVEGSGTYFRLWAPKTKKASLIINDERAIPLQPETGGYHTGVVPDAEPGDRYNFLLHDHGRRIPDPASRFQPEDIFGPSEIVDSSYAWTDQDWSGVDFDEWIIYEIHAGTYSSSHDFDGIIKDLPRLKKLGINAIEIMPVCQFPGTRNWGYDGVFAHAVQHSYGGPEKLKQLVNACHREGIAVVLDVVYNHVGPEGNVLPDCGPYFQDNYKLPWGKPINYDAADNDHVRRYFLQAIWQWLTEFHFDGLRFDAVQMIFDNSAEPFLEEVFFLKREAEKQMGRKLVLIAESDANDSRILTRSDRGGFDAQWADDFHHALHATLTGEQKGYYADYGGLAQLAHIYRQGVLFQGQYSPYRKRRHGRSYEGIRKNRLIVEVENHDQIGNRLHADRLETNISADKMKLAAAAVLLSPFTPLLFMGQEWGCRTPFHYFINYHDQRLIDSSREGRKQEWKDFGWAGEPRDPEDEKTFYLSVLPDDKQKCCADHEDMYRYHKTLIALSKRIRKYTDMKVDFDSEKEVIVLTYALEGEEIRVVLNFSSEAQDQDIPPFSAKVFERGVP